MFRRIDLDRGAADRVGALVEDVNKHLRRTTLDRGCPLGRPLAAVPAADWPGPKCPVADTSTCL